MNGARNTMLPYVALAPGPGSHMLWTSPGAPQSPAPLGLPFTRVRELPGIDHYPQLKVPDEVARFIDETAAAWRSKTA